MKSLSSSRLAWLVMGLIVVAGLVVGALDDSGPGSNAERARSIAEGIKCPTCRSQSAADSDASAARAIRTEIARRVDAGESNDEIRNYFSGRYGEEILLTPRASGLAGLVWVIPVAALVVAFAGLAVVLRQWQHRSATEATEADRVLVDRALERR